MREKYVHIACRDGDSLAGAEVRVVTIRDKRGQTPSCRLREPHDSNGQFRTAEDLTDCLSRILTRDRFRGRRGRHLDTTAAP